MVALQTDTFMNLSGDFVKRVVGRMSVVSLEGADSESADSGLRPPRQAGWEV